MPRSTNGGNGPGMGTTLHCIGGYAQGSPRYAFLRHLGCTICECDVARQPVSVGMIRRTLLVRTLLVVNLEGQAFVSIRRGVDGTRLDLSPTP